MKKKNNVVIIVLIVAMILSLIPCQTVKAASISKKSLYLIKGQTYTLRVKGVRKKVKWKSTNKNVVKVYSDGMVKARKTGTAVIKAKVGKKTFKCKVKVYKRYSNKKLKSMVKKYYKSKGYTIPKGLYIDITPNSEKYVTVHVYTVQNDGPNSGHTATWDWFDINVHTGKGTDTILYNRVDFEPYAN